MEGRELHDDNKRLQSFPKFPVWIIEHVWAHRMMDIQEVVDPSHWPDVDSQPLNLEDTWRLRVASAQVYSIVKNRDVENFERVMGFLESTYRLLPGLVAPIKHMKIMFGLKTMVIMWMLRAGRGMVETVFKIIKFFPSKLPQYQDQCSQHDMFLMRKNHLDFKTLAQALATDKNKLEDYVKKHMEEQYGEHYAQKVEDRLLHYLHKLETVLPGDTYIDKILKKSSPVTEEEKLLLEVVTCDSMSIAATLKKLLHCDFASCRQARISQSPENRETEIELSNSALHGRSSKAVLKSVVSKAQLDVFRRREKAAQKVSRDSTDVWGHQQTKQDGGVVNRVEEESSDKREEEISQRRREPASSPHFCSKHQRWVKSILQECPDECSEELLLQANVSLSPLLFQSSSSTSSSQDLTPSDLIPCPPDQHPPSQTVTQLQTAAQASDQTQPKDKRSSGSASDTSQKEPLPQPSSCRDTPLPALLSPVVRLIDIAYVTSSFSTIKPYDKSPNHLTMSTNKQAASSSTPHVLTHPHCHSENKDSVCCQPESVDLFNIENKLQTAPASTSCQPTTLRTSKLSRKYRRTCTNTPNRHSPSLDGFSLNTLGEQSKNAPTIFRKTRPPLLDFVISGPPTHEGSTSASQLVQSGTLSSVCTANQIPSSITSSQQTVPPKSLKPHPQMHNTSFFQLNTPPCSTVVSSASNSGHLDIKLDTSKVHRARMRSSLPRQAVLPQPYVSIIRLSSRECHRITNRRCSARCVEPVSQGNNHEEIRTGDEEANSSFDPNTLYSSHSSSSDGEDSTDHDPDYKPCIKKKRLLLEYEAARILNHI